MIDMEDLYSQKSVLLLTGIAKPKPLIDKIKQYVSVVQHHAYPDHHQFTQKNMLKLVNDFKLLATEEKIIITTQKDAVRLRSTLFKEILSGLPIYEWPIETDFFENDKLKFNKIILEYAQAN
jgi:tetraacyldisaccharide 4'-kinase